MGGLAFTKGLNALNTPRMPPAVYRQVRDSCHALLRQIFVMVATPIEGPGKSDFGDIDIFVAVKKEEFFGASFSSRLPGAMEKYPWDAIIGRLGAERKIQEQDGVAIEIRSYTMRYLSLQARIGEPKTERRHMTKEAHSADYFPVLAIPWPKEPSGNPQDTPSNTGDKDRFIQVDIHICSSSAHLNWMLFKNAHGDIWNLLGSIIRPYGLTVDEVGLYLRIPEIEKLDKKKAKVLLTTDPCQILRFLGLKFGGNQWEEKFDSVEEIFEYVATSRFFWVKPAPETHQHDDGDGNSNGSRDTGGEFLENNLKSNDRRRMTYRPLFRKWIEEFIPSCLKQGRFLERTMTRETTKEEAFQWFGVREVYELRILEFRKQRQKDSLWKEVIKPAIPTDIDPQFRSLAASAMKKIIMEDNTTFGLQPALPLRDEHGMYLEDKVRAYVKANWEEVGRVAWEMNSVRCREALAAKGTKRTVLGSEKKNATPGQ